MSSSHPHSHNSSVPVDAAETSIDQSVVDSFGNISDAALEPPLSSEKIPPLFQLPQSKQRATWIWIAVLASLGLHVGLMLIPTGTEPKPELPKEQEKQVRITQLPTLTKTPVTKTVPKPLPLKPQSIAPARSTIPALSQSIDRPSPTPADPKPQPTSKPTEPTSTENNSWADFPIYPNAQPGCYGLQACLQSRDALAQVSAYFAKELTAKKYENKLIVQEASREVYRISRNGQVQFLTILQTDNGAAYVLAEAPRTLDELKKAVEVPPEVAEIFTNLEAQAAHSSLFAQPEKFYNGQTQKSGIRNISLIASPAATIMDEFFRSNLQNNGFEVVDLPQQYGNGSVYQVKKGTITLYLNLVPTKDGSGTLVVTWKSLPV